MFCMYNNYKIRTFAFHEPDQYYMFIGIWHLKYLISLTEAETPIWITS